MSHPLIKREAAVALRFALIVNGLVFAAQAALNFGVQLPLGAVTLAFPARILPAGIGEAMIGIALLAAGVSQSRTLAWIAFWLSVAGTAFGLAATSVGYGPVWTVHVVDAALALILFGLLIWNGRADVRKQGINTAEQQKPRRVIWLMLLTAVTLLAAAIIHLGPALPINGFGISDQFDSAAVPEAILGILLAACAAYLASGRSGSRELALAATIFTLLLSLFGLSLTLPAGRTGDVVYHLVLVVLLGGVIVGIATSLLRRGSAESRATRRSGSSAN